MSPFQAKRQATKRILVVDDIEDNVSLLQVILTEEGYEVDTAIDGRSALVKIEASPPDLLLLDAMMPKMDGYEVTRRIRQNNKLPFIPILLITAYVEADVPKGLELGANDFIRKPIDYDELLARVKSTLRLKDMMNSPQ
jgi:CheY-like chemotaxis protein